MLTSLENRTIYQNNDLPTAKRKQMLRRNKIRHKKQQKQTDHLVQSFKEKIKLGLYSEQKHHRILSSLSKTEIEKLKQEYAAQTRATAEQLAAKHQAELLAMLESEQTQTKTPKTTRKKKKKAKAKKKKQAPIQKSLPSPKPISRAIRITQSLNTPKPYPFSLHPRIHRWNTSDIDTIRKFKDYKNETLVQQYQNLDDNAIYTQRAHHHLSGIQRIISNEELRKTHCFEYEYGTQNEKIGFGLITQLSFKDDSGIIKNKLGITYVGIGSDDIIYHAMFEERSHIQAPTQLLKNLDTHTLPVLDQKEEQWTHPDLVFELKKDHTLSMEFPNDEQKIHFIFHPVNES